MAVYHPPAMGDRCATTAEHLDEPLAGSAAKARRWLLLEAPGPWGSDPFAINDLPDGLGAVLEERAEAAGIRPGLIQRTSNRAGGARAAATCLVASTERGDSWLGRYELEDPRDVLDLDLAAIGEGRRPAGATPVDGPVVAVCTHSRRDACCALRGRPLLRAVRELLPDGAWATTHLGGHRFAATCVVLPHGYCYGRVPPARAAELVAAHSRGEVVPELLRGRAGDPWHVQCAEVFTRTRLDVRGIDDLRLLDVEAEGDDEGWVALEVAGHGILRAHVRRRPTGAPRALSCGDEETADPGRAELVSLDEAPIAAPG